MYTMMLRLCASFWGRGKHVTCMKQCCVSLAGNSYTTVQMCINGYIWKPNSQKGGLLSMINLMLHIMKSPSYKRLCDTGADLGPQCLVPAAPRVSRLPWHPPWRLCSARTPLRCLPWTAFWGTFVDRFPASSTGEAAQQPLCYCPSHGHDLPSSLQTSARGGLYVASLALYFSPRGSWCSF